MKIMYEADSYLMAVTAVEVERDNGHSVFIKNGDKVKRRARVCTWRSFFNSEDMAWGWLEDKIQSDLDSAMTRVNHLRRKLDRVQNRESQG